MNPTDQPQPEDQDPNDHTRSEQVHVQPLSARVPETVSRGVFATGVVVVTGGSEFVLDFVQNLGNPPIVAARVIMPHGAMPNFIEATRKNISLYEQKFGPPPALPRQPPAQQKPSLQALYDELKVADDVLVGAYANGVMIGHTVSEFKFDFLTNIIPQPAVSSRVYLAAPQVPRMLESLDRTWQQFQERVRQQRQQRDSDDPGPPPAGPPPPG